MKNLSYYFISFIILLFVPSCEDAPPNSFIPVPYVEGYLFVDRPIEGIVVARSQSLSEAYNYAGGMISDADVRIVGGGNSFQLVYRVVDGVGGYWYPDTSLLVQPATTYTITARLKDGTLLSGSTTTPDRIEWTRKPAKVLQYPADTVHLPSPDSLRIEWTPGNTQEFIVRIRCLDTLGYGADPSRPQMN